MNNILKGKKAILFDVGYTLDYPASGDWMFTNLFYELTRDKLYKCNETEIQNAKERSFEYLEKNHLVTSEEEEYNQFIYYYSEISSHLNLELSEVDIQKIAHDRTYNMKNYISYPNVKEVLSTLSKTHRLGIVSDTWPSIERQLQTLDIFNYFSTTTYSCFLGTFKPDKRMFLDALDKLGLPPEDTVFIDDRPINLESAAELGITPILIAANPDSDIIVPYVKIHSLMELL